ncbi:TRAP transporter small permease [Breoghania sp.]|uniref:TRAP transporter small permease subunit n=1 Tax=Breoghania sp. TaxID=2065378 RepID=UPI002AA6740C|nr:TRAP transporter small permease [Breoghania sp.]
MKAYISIVSAVSRACGVLAVLLVAIAALVVCQMVFIRYFLNGSTVWQTEFVVYSLVAATFIGSPFVLLERGHVNVDLLPNMMAEPARSIMNGIAGLFGLAFAALLAWSGWIYFEEAWTYGWTTDTVWAPPLWIPLLPLPFGIGVMCLQYIAEILRPFADGNPGAATL